MFDTHVHFDAMTGQDPSAVLDRAVAAGVNLCVAVGGSRAANEFAVKTAALHPGRVFAAVGYDRDQAMIETGCEGLDNFVTMDSPCALGEMGLDYHYLPDTAEQQKKLFDAQLQLAAIRALPVIVHTREAEGDTLELLALHLKRWTGDPGRIGVIHCFSGDKAFATKVLDMGFLISFSGIITFRNADALRDVAAVVPADRLLVETDSPLLAPIPHRGKPNEPAFLPLVVKAVAEARGRTVEEMAGITTANACRLFGVTEGLETLRDGSRTRRSASLQRE